MAWHVHAGAATGAGHRARGEPCQDAFAHGVHGDVLVATVCDGAGSARHGDIGARVVARQVVHALLARAAAGNEVAELAPDAAADLLAHVIEAVRDALQSLAGAAGAALGDYATTLVGAVGDGRSGFLFHLGDGVAVGMAAEGEDIVSAPDNGEYANETYFVTGPAWRARLRITPLRRPLRGIALMSDGAAAFAMERGGRALFPAFIGPVERHLAGLGEADGSAALLATLADPRTDAITPDDKTLLIALRR
ncbi:PP2C family serine/threonine-protein phosphatase [Coralloluteibacterium thermophilus]|uniref:PP2C family serine/threonine-protein phosphatase n=1 Tax=Coralloluteibacterium thermophilum TaxID=2707049 RepID=A0ABV9NP46_9GAMM